MSIELQDIDNYVNSQKSFINIYPETQTMMFGEFHLKQPNPNPSDPEEIASLGFNDTRYPRKTTQNTFDENQTFKKDVIIEGNLTLMSSNINDIQTEIHMSDQLVIDNSGTAPSLIVNQENTSNLPIVQIKDDGFVVLEVGAGGVITQNPTIDGINTRLYSIETLNSSQNSRLDSIESLNSTQTSRLDGHDSSISAINTLNTTQNSRLDGIDSTNSTQNSRLDSIESLNTTQTSRLDGLDSSITSINTVNTTQNSRLDSIESINTTQNSRLDSIESLNSAQNTRLTNIETLNTTQTSRLDGHDTTISAINSTNTTQNSRLDAMDSLNSSQNSRLDAIESVNSTQTSDISAINLNRLSSYSYYVNETTTIQSKINTIAETVGATIYLSSSSHAVDTSPITVNCQNLNILGVNTSVGTQTSQISANLSIGGNVNNNAVVGPITRCRFSNISFLGTVTMTTPNNNRHFFQNCTFNTTFTFSSSNANWIYFYDCDFLTSLTIPSTVCSLIFTRCNFNSQTITNNASSALQVIFADCGGLPSFSLGNCVFTGRNNTSTTARIDTTNIYGTIQTPSQPNITSVGTLTALNCSGNISGTLTTASQPNITSVGTLSSLSTTGAINSGTDLNFTGSLKKSGVNFVDSTVTSGSNNVVTSNAVYVGLSGKQNTLTIDSTPTASSTNPVQSGGVYTSLQGKQNTLTFDTTPTSGSTNPVTSGGVYTAIQGVSGGGGSSITTGQIGTLNTYSVNGAISNQNYNLGSVSLSAGTYLCLMNCLVYMENITGGTLGMNAYIGTSSSGDVSATVAQGSSLWPCSGFSGLPTSYAGNMVTNQQVITLASTTTIYFSVCVLSKPSAGTLRINLSFNGNATSSSFCRWIKLL